MQARYGWPDHYLVNEPGQPERYLPYARWIEIVETVKEARIQEWKEERRHAAFVGWHVYLFAAHRARGSHVKSFSEHLNLLSLDDRPPRTVEEEIAAAKELSARFGRPV